MHGKTLGGVKCVGTMGAAAAALLAGASAAQAETVFAVTANQRLVTFNSAAPNIIQSGVAINGLMNNETVLGIDFRPATGELYALGSFSNLYRISTTDGAATRVNGAPFAFPLNGSSFGFDFNPTIDRIRVVSDADQNLVLNPETGAVQANATTLAYAGDDVNNGRNPNVLGSAYTNNFPGATMSQLYGIDTGLDILVTQANNAGTLRTVGSLGVDLADTISFDISGFTGSAFAAVLDENLSRSTFWRINLLTGAATALGEVGGGALITAISVAPVVPGPAVGAVLLAAAGVFAGRRRV